MRKEKMYKAFAIFTVLIFAAGFTGRDAHAILGMKKESKLKKESYEKLVAKNLELRNEVDSLIKEQEQLRGIYKVLLEKVKTLQRDGAAALKGKEDAEAAAVEAKAAIEGMKKGLEDRTGAATPSSAGSLTYEKNLKHLKNSLESSEGKYKKAVAEKNDLEKELESIKENIARQEEGSKKLTDELQSQYTTADTQNQKIDDLSGQLKSALENQEALGRQLESARNSLEEKEKEIKSQYEKLNNYEEAQAKDDDFKKNYQAKEDEIKSLRQTIGELNDAIDGLNAEREKSLAQEEKLKKLEDDLTAANLALQAKESEIENISLIRQNLDDKIKSMEGRLNTDEKAVEKDELRVKEEAEKITKLKESLAVSSSDLNEKVKESEDLRARGRAQNEHIKELEKNIFVNKEALKKQAEKLQAEEPKSSQSNMANENNSAEEFKKTAAAGRLKEEVDRLSAGRKVKYEQVLAIEGDIKNSNVSEKELKDKIDLLDKAIIGLKDSIGTVNSEIKAQSDKALSEESRVKDMESALDNAMTDKRDTDSALQDAVNNVGRIEEAITKASANLPKDAPAGFKSEEVKTLETDLERAKEDENTLRAKTQGAEIKVEDLKGIISAAQDKSKEDAAGGITSGKEKIRAIEEDMVKKAAELGVLKEDLENLTKKISGLEKKRETLMADVRSEDDKISDLKKIMARRMLEISAAEKHGKAGNGSSEGGGGVEESKPKNERAEKKVKSAGTADKKAIRNAEKAELPAEVMRKVNKERLDMHYNLAVVYDRNGMYKDSEREYLKCLKIDPGDADVHYNLGILYDDKLNSNQKAANHYKKYLELRPMGENVMQVRGWLTNLELEQRIGKEMR